jgi:hypothetical protein
VGPAIELLGSSAILAFHLFPPSFAVAVARPSCATEVVIAGIPSIKEFWTHCVWTRRAHFGGTAWQQMILAFRLLVYRLVARGQVQCIRPFNRLVRMGFGLRSRPSGCPIWRSTSSFNRNTFVPFGGHLRYNPELLLLQDNLTP